MTQEERLERARQMTRELADLLKGIDYDSHGSADVADLVEAARDANNATRTLLRTAGRVVERRGGL